jgi:hypothetical protein
MKDWNATARGFDELVYDFDAQGEHLPLIYPPMWDPTSKESSMKG